MADSLFHPLASRWVFLNIFMVTLQCLALVSVPAPAPKLQCARLNLGVHAWAFASGCLVHGENQPMHIQDLVKICHSNYSLALHYGTQLLFSTFKGKQSIFRLALLSDLTCLFTEDTTLMHHIGQYHELTMQQVRDHLLTRYQNLPTNFCADCNNAIWHMSIH